MALQFGRNVYHPVSCIRPYHSANTLTFANFQQHLKTPEESSFLNVASQLPPQWQHPAYLIQKYGVMANRIFRDLCIVIFVIGFTSLCLSICV